MRFRALILAAITLVACQAPVVRAELVQGEATTVPQPTLSVTGTGQVQVAPDTVRITASIVTEGATVPHARDRNARVVQKAMAGVKGLGLPNVATKTLDYTLTRVSREARMTVKMDPQKWDVPWIVTGADATSSAFGIDVPVTLGYRASNSLTVRVQDAPREELSQAAGRIVDVLMEAGCDQITSVTYSLEKEHGDASRQALTRAVKDAQETAAAVAAAAGRRITGIRSITPSYHRASEMRNVQAAFAPGSGEGVSTSLNVGMLELSASVTIQYELDHNPGDAQFLPVPSR